MSNNAKNQLHKLKDGLDAAFDGLTPADARELCRELREHLTLLNSGINRSRHDPKTNAATDHDI
jgi:hypothetical protein